MTAPTSKEKKTMANPQPRPWIFQDRNSWPFPETTIVDQAEQTPAFILGAARNYIVRTIEDLRRAVEEARNDKRYSAEGQRDLVERAGAAARERLAELSGADAPIGRRLAAVQERLVELGSAGERAVPDIPSDVAAFTMGTIAAMPPGERLRWLERATKAGDRVAIAAAVRIPASLGGLDPQLRRLALAALAPEATEAADQIRARQDALSTLRREAERVVDALAPKPRVRSDAA
jgi:hypothetical protein